jgi:hypothetical protein
MRERVVLPLSGGPMIRVILPCGIDRSSPWKSGEFTMEPYWGYLKNRSVTERAVLCAIRESAIT